MAKREKISDVDNDSKIPIGVMPRWRWEELRDAQRIEDLSAAIIRYRKAGVSCDPAWAEEIAELSVRHRKAVDAMDDDPLGYPNAQRFANAQHNKTHTWTDWLPRREDDPKGPGLQRQCLNCPAFELRPLDMEKK